MRLHEVMNLNEFFDREENEKSIESIALGSSLKGLKRYVIRDESVLPVDISEPSWSSFSNPVKILKAFFTLLTNA